ncbi:MAG TPA: hypothetical protein VFJ82_20600 [Longimicrobium sp.]|nr:hypothetical protein [Longimicrobium sp.]
MSAAAGRGADVATELFAWLAARRKGTVYQPDPEPGADDPNGCLPKLKLLLECGYDFSGRSLLSLGASSALYEAALAHQARRGACGRERPGVSAAHLVDTDAGALEHARERFEGSGAADVRTIRALAHEFTPERRYDAGFFLSLFHHYDRLGPRLRALGFGVLEALGRHCRTLFFETGQTGDRVPGAEHWPALLEMASWPSPQAWIETRIPELTGHDAFRRLGTNPATGRHLYAFWRARRPAAGLAGVRFAPLREIDALDDGPPDADGIALRVDPSSPALPVVLPGGGRVALDAVLARAAGRALWVDAAPAAPGGWEPAALGRLAATLRAAPLRGAIVRVAGLDAVDALPRDAGVCWAAEGECEAGVRGVLATAALSGVPLVSLPPRWNTAAVHAAARGQGVALAFADGGAADATITLVQP